MSEWSSLEDLNRLALTEWRLKVAQGYTYPDAWRPYERQYLTFSFIRKLEVARSFVARLQYLRRGAHVRHIAALISRPF